MSRWNGPNAKQAHLREGCACLVLLPVGDTTAGLLNTLIEMPGFLISVSFSSSRLGLPPRSPWRIQVGHDEDVWREAVAIAPIRGPGQ